MTFNYGLMELRWALIQVALHQQELSMLSFDRADGVDDWYGKVRDIRVYNTKEMTDSEVDILLTKITS
jgi:hypothetical protein